LILRFYNLNLNFLFSVVRHRILFPAVPDESEIQNQNQNQNAVHDSDEDTDSENETEKQNSETQKAVNSICVRVVDESNQTVEVMNMNV
jgi:hypothetical protein